VAGWFFDGAVSWLSAILLGGLQLLWKMLAGFALTSPDVTVLPQVREVSARSLLVVNTVYVLAVLAAGIVVMTRESVQTRYGIADLAPRLVIGLVAANLATPLCQGLIRAANALTEALTGDSISAAGSIGQLNRTIATIVMSPGTGPAQLLVVVIAVLLLALTIMLIFSWLIRLGLLVVLTGIAPAALACHGLPQIEGVARLWWRSMLATVSVVTVQAFALHTTLAVFLSPQANLPALGLPLDPGGTINLLIVACLLWSIVRIPALARRYVTRSRPAPVASLVRVLIVQQLTRGLARGAGGRLVARAVRARP
jgi:hypothetical protein